MNPAGIGRLALGTAQFGMNYGIANRTGKPGLAAVRGMLARAREAGIRLLDTAPVYGDAEAALGHLVGDDDSWRIVTKTLPIGAAAIGRPQIEAVLEAFDRSLRRLRRPGVAALLVHHGDELLAPGGDRLWAALQSLKDERRAAKIGVSVFVPATLTAIVERYAIDIVQLPYNLYDQRFAGAGLLTSLSDSGIEVHARSLFLQGLLLLPPARLTGRFAALRPQQARLHAWLAGQGMSVLAGAMALALPDPRIAQIVLGCDTLQQLEQILEAAAGARALPDAARFALSDEGIINPAMWN